MFQQMVDAYAQAIRDADREVLKQLLAPDVVSYDAMPPLVNGGKEQVSDRLDKWIDLYDGPMGCEIQFGGGWRDAKSGFCWFLERITGKTKKGALIDMWVRVTWCLKLVDQAWLIVHENQSDPFDPETLKARIDLTPDSRF